MRYNQDEENGGVAYNFGAVEVDITFIVVAWKDKLDPGRKRLHYVDNKTLALCNHLHRQHANAKLAKNPEC